MDESEDNLSAEEIKFEDGSSVKVKSKKRSLVERELETNLTARVTSPIMNRDSSSTSRYGRTRRMKTETDFCDTDKAVTKCLQSPKRDVTKSPNKTQSPAYKMHASNSPIRVETPKKESLNNQIESIYSENISLSRFRPDEKKSAAKKFPKVYIRKDLIQTKEKEIDDTVVLIKNIFSPTNSITKTKPNFDLETSAEKNYSNKMNNYMNTLSVVKTLDFDGNKKKKRDDRNERKSLSKSELFDLEAQCEYQVGDLAWARMGSYPFWPCIITRDPHSGMFVKKKLFGRIERDVMHVTFFGDNGRRGWIVDSMLRKFLGQLEFEAARMNFSAETKKKDPRLFAAFFISEKKTPQWQISVEEAEALLREPKRLRIDILNDMIEKSRALKTTPKQEKGRKITRTNSDVSLSESLYDTLFSEDDSKVKETERSRSKSRNKSLDVSEVVTACLDNMAAKTGITRIQRQSHMDRWLQKAKSKTPEKSHKSQIKESSLKPKKRNRDRNNKITSDSKHNDHDYSRDYSPKDSPIVIEDDIEYNAEEFDIQPGSGIGIISKVETLCGKDTHEHEKDHINEVAQENAIAQNTDIEQINCVESVLCGTEQTNEISPKVASQISTDVESDVEQVNSVESPEISSIQSEYNDDNNEPELMYEQNDIELNTVNINGIKNSHSIFTKIPDVTDNNILDNIFATDDSSSDVDTNNESIDDKTINNEVNETSIDLNNVNDVALIEERMDVENKDIGNSPSREETDQNKSTNNDLGGNLNNTNSVESSLDLDQNTNNIINNNSLNKENQDSKDQEVISVNNIELCEKDNINQELDSVVENISPVIETTRHRRRCLNVPLNKSIDIVTRISEDISNIDKEENCDSKLNETIEELPQNVSYNEKLDSIENDQETLPLNDIQNPCGDTENVDLESNEESSTQVNTSEENQTQNVTKTELTINTNSLNEEAKAKNPITYELSDQNEGKTDEIKEVDIEKDNDNVSVVSEGSDTSRRKRAKDKPIDKKSLLSDVEFLKYLELRQDAVMDEHPELSQEEITSYLYKTWLYEENLKPDIKKCDDIDQANLVKGLNSEPAPVKKARKRVKVEKEIACEDTTKEKSKRKIIRPYYKEDFSDGEDSVEYFDIFKSKKDQKAPIVDSKEIYQSDGTVLERIINVDEYVQDEYDDVEEYFRQLTAPKPNVFKGYVREKVCEICEKVGGLVKCKGCHSMFHVECDKKEIEIVECQTPTRGRRRKKKTRGRKAKDDQDSGSDEKSQDTNGSDELHMSLEEESHIIANADDFEAQMSMRMQEMLKDQNIQYDFYSREELDWNDTHAGECKVVDIKPRMDSIEITDYSEFKCKNCQKYDPPVCFVCKYPISPKEKQNHRQKCQVAHCNKYYHLECLDHWPQTQFNAGEVSRTNKFSEALTCPRHVCHTCVCDDPRGCKTRFSGDKLARCVRCPATYHTFTKCLPAGSQILTASHIICPRHYEHRPGKVPCHVNTGWCFICALGGSLICCEYCPTSFHAECLNIKPPEGGYMCEDCETGRLPLYGEMVWVKLGHYRWWPGIILHPSEIPDNILTVKHTLGEFVVRFFGQYDYYWVNRGRVFPFQEGDSGKVSSQKSKIDAAFTMAMEHAQRACSILKMAAPNEEESSDIASSLLPPHYVKLKVNKPCGSLCGKKIDLEESSLTQCECDPNDIEPCGPYTQCLNRMLLTECGPTCRAGDRCNNRAFEKRLYPRLGPYRTPHRGWGLRTMQDIKAGQFVIEYVGELIDEEEFRRRMNRKHEVRDENFYFLTLDKERMIDAGPKGNLARFMNHSCEPNCETQKWTVLGDVRVGLFALRDIPANSELTFNYNLETSGIEKKRCMCGAKRCSGYIGAKPKQEDQPKKIKPQVKRIYRKRKAEESPSTSQNKKRGRPIKPRELTEIEKDLLIIKNATNGLSSDSECSRISMDSCKDIKALKRKRINLSTEELSPKRSKIDEMNLVY
ncbi:unnamed protein product [Danaus chrysippus]|uniref:(African queen) hypothetical protein n=1 Tax=Danaus chrysippus TaxID=151541 RepID=A0A8J2QTR2_9NEOP|nr:unnamed protein product [Danaus chrysippus]